MGGSLWLSQWESSYWGFDTWLDESLISLNFLYFMIICHFWYISIENLVLLKQVVVTFLAKAGSNRHHVSKYVLVHIALAKELLFSCTSIFSTLCMEFSCSCLIRTGDDGFNTIKHYIPIN